MRTPKHPYGNVVLITGASSGIGAAAARLFAEHGYTVWGASRFCSEERTPCGAGEIRTVRMDVTDEASVRRAVEIVLRESGEIGVLLHCAGYGIAGAAEDTPVEAAAAQMDTNYFGVLRVNRAVMPAMREKGAGLVLVMSSVAGRVAIPFQSQYSASKFALEATVEAMRAECAPYGIRAALIEPGDTNTGFTGARKMMAPPGSVYEQACRRAVGKMERDERRGKPAVTAAKAALRLAGKQNPPLRRVVGADYRLLALLIKLLPDRVRCYLIARLYTGGKKE